MWYTEQVAKQLNESKAPADVEVSLDLSEIKPLHAKWIYEMYEYLRGRSDLVWNGLESAGIIEAVEKTNEVLETHFLFLEIIKNCFETYSFTGF